MSRRYEPMGIGAVLDLSFDASPYLESGETLLGTSSVVSNDLSLITISNVQVTSVQHVVNGITMKVGTSLVFRATVQAADDSVSPCPLVVTIKGDGGTVQSFSADIPIVTTR